MNKIIYFLIFNTALVPSLYTKEPTMAFLRSINLNESLKFSKSRYEFYCKPYGILTIDDLYSRAKLDSTCKNSIDKFYKKNPRLKYFTQGLLKTSQLYRVEFKNKRCIVYVQGQKILSEVLLENGLAVKVPGFKDELYKDLFAKAQEYAKYIRKGMFKDNISYKCIAELYAQDK